MEDAELCNLIDPVDTYPINSFKFGDKPKSDTCDEIEINCIYDEIYNDEQELLRWFE